MKLSSATTLLALLKSAQAYTNCSVSGEAYYSTNYEVVFSLNIPLEVREAATINGTPNNFIVLSDDATITSQNGESEDLSLSDNGWYISNDFLGIDNYGVISFENTGTHSKAFTQLEATYTIMIGSPGLAESSSKMCVVALTASSTSGSVSLPTSTSSTESLTSSTPGSISGNSTNPITVTGGTSSSGVDTGAPTTITTTECASNGTCSTITYCPIPTSITVPETIVTITSCANDVCTSYPVTTGITTITSGETVYTTYCPITAVMTSSSFVSQPTGTMDSGSGDSGSDSSSGSGSGSSSDNNSGSGSGPDSGSGSGSDTISTTSYADSGATLYGSSVFALGVGILAIILQ